MTHREYWQCISEIKTLTSELLKAWDRFDSRMKNIHSHLAKSRVILREADEQKQISEALINQIRQGKNINPA